MLMAELYYTPEVKSRNYEETPSFSRLYVLFLIFIGYAGD